MKLHPSQTHGQGLVHACSSKRKGNVQTLASVPHLSRLLLQCLFMPGRYQQSLGNEGCKEAIVEGMPPKTGAPGSSMDRSLRLSSSFSPWSPRTNMVRTGHWPSVSWMLLFPSGNTCA